MASEYAFPTTEVEFTKQGELHDLAQIDSLRSMIDDEGIANLIVLSHGWNNDMSEARRLYHKLLDQVQRQSEAGHVDLDGRRLGVLAVLWPSKKFAERDLIASGAAGLGGALGDEAVIADIKGLSDAFDVPDADAIVDQLTALVPALEDSPQAQRDFADLARRLLVDSSDEEVRSEVPDRLREMPGDELLNELGKPDLSQMVAPGEPGDIGTAAGLGSFLSGIKGGALTLMNLLTYYQMKDRAGIVGMRGLRPVLEEVVDGHPSIKLHLVGHSFGARLVTAAIRGKDNAPRLEVASLTLLQGAFSHNGLAANYDQEGNDGYFRLVMSDHRVSGPVVITYTINDRAVGLGYPIASRIAGHDAAGIGDAQSLFGGMGRNGAQHTPEAVAGQLGPSGTIYDFKPGKVHNLLADKTISSHSDVANEAVGGALAAAIGAT
jgi:hypothetical protein